MGGSPDEVDRRSVPSWAVRLISDAAETKATVAQIAPQVNETRQKIEGLVTRDEYNARHGELVKKVDDLQEKRVNPLWDAMTSLQSQIRTSRIIFGVALALLTLWAGLRTAHLI